MIILTSPSFYGSGTWSQIKEIKYSVAVCRQGAAQNVLGPATDGVAIDIAEMLLNYFHRNSKSNTLLNFSKARCFRSQVKQVARALKNAQCGT